MAASTLNYFTCTLGQAAIWKRESATHLKSFDTVLELVERQASVYPHFMALGFADSPFKESQSSMFVDDLCSLITRMLNLIRTAPAYIPAASQLIPIRC
jgi:hypothetical protein